MKQIIRAVVFTIALAFLAGCPSQRWLRLPDEGCRFKVVVKVNYLDKDGNKVIFESDSVPELYRDTYCNELIDIQTSEKLSTHNNHIGEYNWGSDTAFVAAPARDGKIHTNIRGKLRTAVHRKVYEEDGRYVFLPMKQTNDIEVELFYESPDEAYIVRIVVDSIERWNRNDYKAGEVPKRIVIDVPFDIANLE